MVQNGRFFSIKAGNSLIFRTPGFADGEKEADFDILLIWPKATPISVLSRSEWREFAQSKGQFAVLEALPCANLDLTFTEALKMNEADWTTFAQTCGEVVKVGKTRTYVSKVELPPIRRAQASSS